MGKAFVLIQGLVMRRVPTPAMNRWLLLRKVISVFAMMFGFHKILYHAYVLRLNTNDASAGDLTSSDEDRGIGLPVNEIRAFRKVSLKRDSRSMKWILDRLTFIRLVIWLAVANPMMHIHYHLFSRGSHLGGPEGSNLLFELSNMSKSIAVKKLHWLFCSMTDGTPEFRVAWALLCAATGTNSSSGWSQEVIRLVHVSIMSVMASLWRRFIHPYLGYPFCLAGIADPDSTPAQVRAIIQDFLVAFECCLDADFSLKLRQLFPTERDLLSDVVVSLCVWLSG